MTHRNNKVQRREFIKQTGLLAATLVVSQSGVLGKSFAPYHSRAWSNTLEKKLDPKWIKSLYNRGNVTTCLKSKNELQYIGMPVGGINCGTVYLGGDGRLWLWDIFNKNQEGIEPKTAIMDGQEWKGTWRYGNKIISRDGAAYVAPAKDIRPLDQGFAFKIKYNDKTIIKELRPEDWDEIAFEATYPLATVRYYDKNLPVKIVLEAFSPFIPLDEDNSNLPATVLLWKIENNSKQDVEIEILGWLENAVNKFSAKAWDGKRVNTVIEGTNSLSVLGHFNAVDENLLKDAGDTGSMCLSLINNKGYAIPALSSPVIDQSSFSPANEKEGAKDATDKLTGCIVCKQKIAAGKSVQIDYAITWYFPNVGKRIDVPEARAGHYYAGKFENALAVSNYVTEKFNFLSSQTRLWKNTWYNSTLPWWFLERTFLNISTMATTTSHRFKNGRSWAWEGVGSCEGNCTHVWQYAQAVGRIFPGIERDNRHRVDLGISLQPDGGIWFRGEYDKRPAIDGQAGTVLRMYREHQMSADDKFLTENWNNIKKAVAFIIAQDKNKDGMEDTPMENTLDAVWYGEIAWIVGLCVAAVRAGEEMAAEVGDKDFAELCAEYVSKGRSNMEKELFNGEYFIHKPDAQKGRSTIGSYNTSHIDQVYGQSWAFQVGLGRVLDKEKTLSALRSLWKYNFTTDVGPYTKMHEGGRPYALPGEGGMIMNTNPKNEEKPYGSTSWQAGYFNECMSGFEHQVASHMIAEGMVDEGLIITRTIHDRYHAAKRNPFNEIECSDHYARAMASYGSFITACGFEYHGPKGYIRFAPKWSADNFKAPFTSAQGWGTYSQRKIAGKQLHRLELKYGLLELQMISFEKLNQQKTEKVSVMLGAQPIPAHFKQQGTTIVITLLKSLQVQVNQHLTITV